MFGLSQPRYAIYFVPNADTDLYRFGAAVLGYDCYSGRDERFLEGADAKAWSGYVRDPRVYGFHATLKAPFYLASGCREADLERALTHFAVGQDAVPAGDLALRELGAFIALVPHKASPPLDRLAQSCVSEFDRFRGPMSGQERARRMTPGLSKRQIENLNRWGYPHVFKDFRFHMTLTGSLPLQKRSKALRFLGEKFGEKLGGTKLLVDQIVISRQNEPSGQFQVIAAAALTQRQLAPAAYQD